MQFPILSVIVFTPMVAALIILLIPPTRKAEVRVTALAASIFALALSAWVYFSYDIAAGGYQFVEKYSWLPCIWHLLPCGAGRDECPARIADRYRHVYGSFDLLGH